MRLDNNWVEISNQIARGAIDGILDLVRRIAPQNNLKIKWNSRARLLLLLIDSEKTLLV